MKLEPKQESIKQEHDILSLGPSSLLNQPGSSTKHVPQTEFDEEEIKRQLKGLRNNKLKVKKAEGLTLSLDSIHDRLKGVGYKPYPVELDDETRNKTVTRAFISAQYGGSAFSTFPTISKEHLDRHKMNDWMFPNLSFNPYAPQMAGAPGLLFVAGDPKDDWPTIQRVIVGLDTNAWLYIGFYQMLRSASLTQEEWLRQDFKMQNTWANYLHKKDLGRFVRARIALRIIHGRKPTKREMEEALSGKQTYTHITPEQILKAYNDGEETICVYVMKCVGYDVDFQVSMTNDYTSWASPSRKKKPSGKNSKVIKKRKRSDDADSGEDRKSGEKLLNETENFTEEIYVPRPTRRSRRRKLSTTD